MWASWDVNTSRVPTFRLRTVAPVASSGRPLVGTLVNAGHEVTAKSASFMTEPGGTELTDEASPLYLDAPEPLRSHVHANLTAEVQVTGTAGVEGVVLRYGFLYGAGTSIGPVGDIAVAVKAGEKPIVGQGAGFFPLVHVRDAVSATVQAIDQSRTGIYNIVDDEPAAQAVWMPSLPSCWWRLLRDESLSRRPPHGSVSRPSTTAIS